VSAWGDPAREPAAPLGGALAKPLGKPSEWPRIGGRSAEGIVTGTGGEIRFGRFALSPGRAELRRDGERVPVEPRVFDLILHLARSHGRVIGHDELIEEVWGGRIVSDAAIASCVAAARAALGDDGRAQRVIRTVPRRGFRFLPAPEDAAQTAPRHGPGGAPAIRYLRAPDGVSLAHAALGEGPWLVKTASFLTHLQHEAESPIWRHWVRELSAGFRYLRYDQRGNGLSDRDVADISVEAFLRDLEGVMDGLAIPRAILLGISQGAGIAVEYARRHPGRVRGLVLVGGFPAGWRRLGLPEFEARREALLRLIPVGWGQDTPAFRQIYSSLFFPAGTEAQHGWFNELQRVSAAPEAAVAILEAVAGMDVRESLAHVACPTLVAHSRGDEMVPFDAGREMAIRIPGARFLPLESVNHLVQEDEPAWPVFLEALDAFAAELA
jgi:pimeloyl-ACP methyl ester carboxylesterase